jgi:hypothetical protein
MLGVKQNPKAPNFMLGVNKKTKQKISEICGFKKPAQVRFFRRYKFR